MTMAAPIAIIFANLKGNLGDFAILHAMLLDAERRFPGHPIHVFPHASLAIDHDRLDAFRACGVPPFEIVGYSYSKKVPRRLKILRNSFLWPSIQAHFINKLQSESDEDASRFQDYAAILIAGGEQFGKNIGTSMFGTILSIHKYNTEIYTYPFSINSEIPNIYSKKMLKSYFEKLKSPLIVRDSRSKEIIESIGLDAVQAPDCVFSLFPLAETIKPQPHRDNSRIFLALTGSSEVLERSLRHIIRNLRDEFPNLSLLTTCEVVDGKAMRKISDEFGVPFYAPATWQDAVAELKASSLVITNRLHCFVFSLFAGVPVLPIVNRQKVAAIARDLNIAHTAASIEEVSSGLLNVVKASAHVSKNEILSYLERSSEWHRSQFWGHGS